MDEIVAHNNFFVLRIRKKLQLEAYNTLPGKVRRLKEKEVISEMTAMEEYIAMEEELTNDQDAVVNNIRDVTSRFEHLSRVLKTKQRNCHSVTSWLVIMAGIPIWIYAAIFVSLTIDTYRKHIN
ncbi:hypothetical protein ACHWQZ_G002327 [Mnemiopsis leidyi]